MKYFFLMLLCLPFIEVYVYVLSIEHLGGALSFFLSLLSIALGFYLFKFTGFYVLKKIQGDLARAKLPTIQILRGVRGFVAAVLLVIPGFFTDFLALMLFIPGLSHAVLFLVAKRIDQSIKSGAIKVYKHFEQSGPRQHGEVIEVDFKAKELLSQGEERE